MANNYSGAGIDLPFSASGDLSAAQYRFVAPAGAARGVIRATGGSGPAPIGVLQNDPVSGEAATVRVFGTTLLYANADSGAIGYRDWLTSASDGQAILAAGSALVGMALGALASGSGVLIEAYVFPNYLSASAGIPDNTP
jgi:hypothetical protein